MATRSSSGPEAKAAMMRRWSRHWLRSCREMPGRALAVLDRHDDDPGRQIHEFRRLMKAWRALLKLAPIGLAEEGKAIRACAGRLRRGFGGARDSAVIAKVLGKLCPDRAPKGDAEAAMAAAAVLMRDQGDAVRTELQRLSAAMAGWSLADETGEFLAQAFRRSYRRARRQARGNPRRMSVEHLHDWRTTVVDLSYQLSFFAWACPARLRRQAGMAERLRSGVGKAIDLDMVRTHLAEEALASGGKRLAHEIERKEARQCRRAAKLADRLLARRPRREHADLAMALARHPPRRVSFA